MTSHQPRCPCFLCDLQVHTIVGWVECAARSRFPEAEKYLRVAFTLLGDLGPEDLDRVFQAYESHCKAVKDA